jgi:mannose-P-dolichol utilization defect 1
VWLQIWSNFSNGNTGVLSAVTTFMNVAGTAGRLGTVLHETDDILLTVGSAAGAALNVVLALQILWYWQATVQQTAPPASNASAKAATASATPSPRVHKKLNKID